MVSEGIPEVGVKAQSLRADGNQVCIGKGIAAGEQCYVVASTDQLLCQPGYNSFRASIEARRHALVEWRHLRNSHSHLEGSICRADAPHSPCFESEARRARVCILNQSAFVFWFCK